MSARASPPRLRFSLRWKITLPFMLLALALALGVVYLLNRVVGQGEQERFVRQLADSGRQAADSLVRAESDLLTVERLIANTEGVLDGVRRANSEDLRARVLPLVINAGVDFVAVLDSSGTSLLAVRRPPAGSPAEYETLRGEDYYAVWPSVQKLLRGEADPAVGDKHAGLETIRLADQELPVFFIGGPLKESSGRVVGAVLTGRYLPGLLQSVSEQAGAGVSVYDLQHGQLLSTSLEPEGASALAIDAPTLRLASAAGDERNPVRSITVSGSAYAEVLRTLTARQGTETLGVMGISLPQFPVLSNVAQDMQAIIRYSAAALFLVVVVGLLIANSITRPIIAMADASARVAMGNLETRVAERGTDEVALLARTFNQMVDGLRERTLVVPVPATVAGLEEPSPSPAAEPAATLTGVHARGSVLSVEVRWAAGGQNGSDPEAVFRTLNQFASLVFTSVGRHGGTIASVDGRSFIAHFGVSPRPVPAAIAALQATHAGMEIVEAAWDLARLGLGKGEEAPRLKVGVATGPFLIGSVAPGEHPFPVLVGSAILEVQALQQVARQPDSAFLLITEETYRSLGSAQRQFAFGRYGQVQLSAADGAVAVHEVRSRLSRLIEPHRA